MFTKQFQWTEYAEEATCKKTEFELIFRVTWNKGGGIYTAVMTSVKDDEPLDISYFLTKEAAMHHCELKFQHMILNELSDFSKTVIKKAAEEHIANAFIALELN